MNDFFVIASIAAGILLRLGIPLTLTLLLGWFLRRIDSRWREEGMDQQLQKNVVGEVRVLEPCWEVMNCPEYQRLACPAYLQTEIPCWELFRLRGISCEACLTCEVRLQPAVLAIV